MIVYVVLREDSLDRIEILGVRLTKESGQKFAEEQEPTQKFEWIHDNEDNSHVIQGPTYTYYVERHDVQ